MAFIEELALAMKPWRNEQNPEAKVKKSVEFCNDTGGFGQRVGRKYFTNCFGFLGAVAQRARQHHILDW